MSYILDALRKADAQRERDASRGIHANPATLGPSGNGASGSSRGMWIAIAVGIGVAVAAGSYYVRGLASAPAPAVASNLPPAAPVKMQTPQAVASAIVPPPPVVAPATPPMRPTPQANLPPGVAVPGLSADERSRQAREAAFSDPSRMPMAPGAPRPATAPQVAQTAVTPPVTGLPPDAPKVAISGGVYSSSPAQRMLIVNGQVFNEGSEVAPGLAIEKIEPRTATLTFRGARYVVAY
jgi:general secretion pathway protein B